TSPRPRNKISAASAIKTFASTLVTALSAFRITRPSMPSSYPLPLPLLPRLFCNNSPTTAAWWYQLATLKRSSYNVSAASMVRFKRPLLTRAVSSRLSGLTVGRIFRFHERRGARTVDYHPLLQRRAAASGHYEVHCGLYPLFEARRGSD